MHAHLVDVEEQRQVLFEPHCDQILDDLGLAVDDDAAATGQLVHRHVVPLAVELQVDAAVHDRLAVQALGHARPLQQVDGPLLEHAGADARLDVLAASVLEHDRFDSRPVKQRGENQAGGTGTDDRDVSAQAHHDSSSTACATAKARFAAGTPQ